MASLSSSLSLFSNTELTEYNELSYRPSQQMNCSSQFTWWSLGNAALYENGQWTQIVSNANSFLKIYEDKLFVICDNFIEYQMELGNEMKGFSKNEGIMIIFEKQGQLKRLKMKINTDTPEDMNRIIEMLACFFPIEVEVPVEVVPNPEIVNSVPNPINCAEAIKKELERPTNYRNTAKPIPPNFRLEKWLEACILDPNFPDMVDQVEKAIHQYLY